MVSMAMNSLSIWIFSGAVALTVSLAVAALLWVRSKAKFREIAGKYKALVESFSDLVFLLDKDGRYIEIIANQETLLVNRAAELHGKTIYEVMPEKNAREIHKVILDTLAHGPQVVQYTLDVPAGSKTFEGRTSQLKADWSHSQDLVVWVSRDITEQVQAEERQRGLEAQLVQAQKMEAIAVTAGGVAHDLNNLLSSIVVYPDILISELPKGSKLIPYLEQIRQSGEQSAKIVRDLLLLSRKSNRESKLIDLNQLIRDFSKSSVVTMLKADSPDVELVFELSEKPVFLKGSGIHLTKVLMNLVINAFEAIAGKGQVTISTAISENGDQVILAVEDTGVGMSRSQTKNIFDPFYSEKKVNQSGTGLGLAVVWGIVKDHSGEIAVDSEPGKGSLFTLNFPRHRQTQKISIDPLGTVTDAAESTPRKILVVDDFKDQREVLEDVLSRLGHVVYSAGSGEEALETLRSETDFDLVIMDMKMGDGMDGLDTYRKIRKISPLIPTVILTGHSDGERVQEAQELGVKEVAIKPLNFDQIRGLVERNLTALPEHPQVSRQDFTRDF